jgi:hypothetical protein
MSTKILFFFFLFNSFLFFIREKNDSFQLETRFELHKLLKDNLRKDDLQDNLINKLYNFER